MKILLADDHKILREGLRILLENQPDMKVVGEAENGRTAVRLAKKLRPDIVIMDVTMSDLNGIEATLQIIAQAPGVKVLALSMHSDRRFAARMLGAGASGYLLKDCAFEELSLAILTVAKNHTYLSPAVADLIIKDYKDYLKVTQSGGAMALSPREREILQAFAEGKTTSQIADLLHISVKTVETHRKKIMDKLNLHSIAELTKFAIREGISPLEG